MTTFHKYRSTTGEEGINDIRNRCKNAANYTNELSLSNTFSLYEKLINYLYSSDICSVVSLQNLMKISEPKRVTVALRHDVDADIVTAVKCARTIEKYKLHGTFYILHTSHYYGYFSQLEGSTETAPQFVRHTGLPYYLKQLNETGCEIGLHNDALGVYFDHHTDGASAFVKELSWLRQQDLNITGTAAHNSASVYAAECFEIFADYSVGGRKVLKHLEKVIPLQTLNSKQMKLTYEANWPLIHSELNEESLSCLSASTTGNALHDQGWLQSYFIDHPIFERSYDVDIWVVGRDLWLLAGKQAVQFPLNYTSMIKCLENLPKGSRVVISIHPIYMSR